MRELLSNVGRVCKHHAPVAGKFTGQDPASFLGKYVKLGFPAHRPDGTDTTEHMWVLVESLAASNVKAQLTGTLNNDPILETEYACGDLIAFDVSEIEAVSAG
jgi:uncharacterized protein YegJ (DUF2314 family)